MDTSLSSGRSRTKTLRRRTTSVVGLAVAALLSACFLAPEEPVQLTVQIEGQGRVFSFGLDFNCTTPTCTIPLHRAAEGGEFTVHAEARAFWDFGSWEGRCSGETHTSCVVQYQAGTSGELVRAVFVPEP